MDTEVKLPRLHKELDLTQQIRESRTAVSDRKGRNNQRATRVQVHFDTAAAEGGLSGLSILASQNASEAPAFERLWCVWSTCSNHVHINFVRD